MRSSEQESASILAEYEAKMIQWQQEWEDFNEESAETAQKAEVEQERINHLENIVERGKQRKSSIKHELENLQTPDSSDLESLDSNLRLLMEKQTAHETNQQSLKEKIEKSRESIKASSNELNERRSKLQSMLGQKASLDALQKAALGKNDQGTISWLERNHMAENPRLGDNLQVDEQWQGAMEMVLGESLQAVCVSDLDSVSEVLGDFTEGNLQIIDTGYQNSETSVNASLQASPLAEKVRSSQNLAGLLVGIYCVESLQQALSLRQQLKPGESLITREGIWLGPSWLRLAKDFDEKAGLTA